MFEAQRSLMMVQITQKAPKGQALVLRFHGVVLVLLGCFAGANPARLFSPSYTEQ